MKIKTPTAFETFNDGVCEIWNAKNNLPTEIAGTYHYGWQTLTTRRYYAARAANIIVDKVIHINRDDTIHGGQLCIIGEDRYLIEQVQTIADANPPVTVLSLRRMAVHTNGRHY